jgi:hypothetical protein
MAEMTKEALRPYVSYIVDDALHDYAPDVVARHREGKPAFMDPDTTYARYVVWQCGFEPMVVAVVSYLPHVRLDVGDACELAIDLLDEKQWFSDPGRVAPDLIL